MRRILAAAAVGAVLVSTVSACDQPESEPAPAPTTVPKTPPESAVALHETGVDSPLGYELSVPKGATQLGPLVRHRSPALVAAYRKVLDKYEKKRAREARQSGDEPPTTAPPTPFPTRGTFADLDSPPEPDVSTALLRVDGDPGTVFEEMLRQVADMLPHTGLKPSRWSQYCRVWHDLYTGCHVAVSGQTPKGEGVRVTVTIDPGDVRTRTAPAGSQNRPVMTVTTKSTDPIDTSQALDDDNRTAPPPTPASPPSGPSPGHAAPHDAAWATMKRSAATAPGDTLLRPRWRLRPDSTLLLSGDRPAFAMLVTGRRTDADAVARSYALKYTQHGEPRRDVVEDRTEVTVTYTARTGKHGPTVTATYVQAGRGNYIALFYDPPWG